MSATSKCPHLNFHAQVNVARIADVGIMYADVTIKCTVCGAPAEFRGIDDIGLLPFKPTKSVDSREARLPFICFGDDEPKPSHGYSIRMPPDE